MIQDTQGGHGCASYVRTSDGHRIQCECGAWFELMSEYARHCGDLLAPATGKKKRRR